MTEQKKDSIQDFHIIGYDSGTETLTIAVADQLFNSQSSYNAMAQKGMEITVAGPSVKRVVFVPRSEDIKPQSN